MTTILQFEKQLTVNEIANLIQAGKWEEIIDVEILDFYKIDDDGNYVPDPSKRFQVRDFFLNEDFVDEKVQYVKFTGDKSQIDVPTVVRMPDGTYKLDDGSHTIDIKRKLGDVYSKAYVVDYDEHLGGADSNAFGLGNALNIDKKEKQTATPDNIKTHFHQILAEKRDSGLPTDPQKWNQEELEQFCSLYKTKGITPHTLGQWHSRTPEGGRHLLPKQYTVTELREVQKSLSKLDKYKDYFVTVPRETKHASTSILAQSMVDLARKKSSKRKILILFYCKDNADVKRVNGADGKGESRWRKSLNETYKLMSELANLTIEYDILSWDSQD